MGLLVSHPEHLKINSDNHEYYGKSDIVLYSKEESKKHHEECLQRESALGVIGLVDFISVIYLLKGSQTHRFARKALPFVAGFYGYDLLLVTAPKLLQMDHSRRVFKKRLDRFRYPASASHGLNIMTDYQKK